MNNRRQRLQTIMDKAGIDRFKVMKLLGYTRTTVDRWFVDPSLPSARCPSQNDLDLLEVRCR